MRAASPKLKPRPKNSSSADDQIEKMLMHYPGNKVRHKAIVVDLGDFEQLRIQLEQGHQDKVKKLYGFQ